MTDIRVKLDRGNTVMIGIFYQYHFDFKWYFRIIIYIIPLTNDNAKRFTCHDQRLSEQYKHKH